MVTDNARGQFDSTFRATVGMPLSKFEAHAPTLLRDCERFLLELESDERVVMVSAAKSELTIVGAELVIYADTRLHVSDFLAAREKHLRELGFDPASVAALIPSERGKNYSDVGFRNIRIDAFRSAGIEGDFR